MYTCLLKADSFNDESYRNVLRNVNLFCPYYYVVYVYKLFVIIIFLKFKLPYSMMGFCGLYYLKNYP